MTMKLKKFNEYIKEDTSSVYDIEHPFTGDGDDMTTQGDESHDDVHSEVAPDSGIEGEKPMFSEEGIAIDIKGELFKIASLLQKIADGDAESIVIAQGVIDGLVANFEDGGEEGEDFDDDDFEDEDSEDFGDDDYNDYQDHAELPLEEKLKFANFKRRK